MNLVSKLPSPPTEARATRNYAFVFICQQGEWEIKASLLAASLKKFLKCKYELIAALPHPESIWGRPDEDTLSLMAELGARMTPVENEIDVRYPHANKIGCLKIATSADKIVFLDSDILCMREFHDAPEFAAGLSVKPADMQSFGVDMGLWSLAYRSAETPFPTARVAATFSGETGPPYFNSGFIALDAGVPLADTWVACARALNCVDAIPKGDPWSDQTSFAVAVQKLALRYHMLDDRYNFPAHLKKLDPLALPWFCHYHWPSVIEREPLLTASVREFAKTYPQLENLISRDIAWSRLLR